MILNVPLFIPQIYCSIAGHQYKIVKNITEHVKEYKCSCCGKEVATNANGKLVELTPELRNIHSALHNMILKRRSKVLTNA